MTAVVTLPDGPTEAEPRLRGIERRRARRKRTFLPAQLVFNDGACVFDCRIRDLSDTGAQVVLAKVTRVPPEVELVVLTTGERMRARVVRSIGLTHGLMFQQASDSSSQTLTPTAPKAAAAA